MNLSDFNPQTFPVTTPEKGPINSSELNSFFEATVTDFAALSAKLNGSIIKIINSMPSSFNAATDALDGSNLYLNTNSKDIDNNIFWYEHPTDSAQSRPLTIYESMLLFLQVLSNVENGMKEYLKIGDVTTPISIGNAVTIEYGWLFSDGIFKTLLYEKTGNNIRPIDMTQFDIYINTTTTDHKMTITNNSGSTKSIWGFIWHPVLGL